MPPVMRYTYNPSYGPRIITDPITGFPIASLLAYVLYTLYPFTPNTTQQQGPPRPSLQNIHTYIPTVPTFANLTGVPRVRALPCARAPSPDLYTTMTRARSSQSAQADPLLNSGR
jgi:hypothetical protein